MEIASGQVRISGAHVFINDLEVSGLKPAAPKPHIRRSAAGGQSVAPGPAGKGAQGQMDRAAYWSDKSHASAYNAKYHGRMATNRHGRPVYQYTDCGRFVHEVVKDDDPNFPAVGTGTMKNYIKENWTHGTPGEGGGPQPGDVLVVHNSK